MLLTLRDVIAAARGKPRIVWGMFNGKCGGNCCLDGRNGMGKSTTVKCICRMMPRVRTLIFGDKNLVHLSSAHACQAGIGLVPEGRRWSNLLFMKI